jgi:hypothetical protein
MILNMHIGHSFLQKEFGVTPKIGWMLDAFGHSEANAALFADFGFEAFFFSRMNGHERTKIQKERKTIFLWEPLSANYGSSKQILTQVFYFDYGAPPGFSDEHATTKEDVIPYEGHLHFNLDKRCGQLQNFTNDVANTQLSEKNVMVLWGNDFTCSNQYACYKAIDKVIDYCNKNQNSNMTFMYSTPTRYVNALKAENIRWAVVRNHDYFPYYEKHT